MANISFEELSSTRLSVKISVSQELWGKAENSAASIVGNKKALPGFRKGKAPASLILAKYKEEVNYDLSIKVLEESLSELIEKTKHDIYRVIEIKISGNNEISVVYDVQPKVELCKLKEGELYEPEPIIEEASLEEELLQLRRRFATTEDKNIKDSPISGGDVIEFSYELLVNGIPNGPVASDYAILREGEAKIPTQVQDYIIANQPELGVEFTVSFELPAPAHHHHDGEECHHDHGPSKISWIGSVKSVKTLILPNLDDAFAKQVNPKFATVAELKLQTIESLSSVIKRDYLDKQINEVVDIYVSRSQLWISESYLEDECNTFLQRRNIPRNKLSEDDIKLMYDIVLKDIQRSLIYKQLVDQAKEMLKDSPEGDIVTSVRAKHGDEMANNLLVLLMKSDKGETVSDSELQFINYFRNEYFFNLLFTFFQKNGLVKKGDKITVPEYKEFLKQRKEDH